MCMLERKEEKRSVYMPRMYGNTNFHLGFFEFWKCDIYPLDFFLGVFKLGCDIFSFSFVW